MISLYRSAGLLSLIVGMVTALMCIGFQGTIYSWTALLPIGYVFSASLLLAVSWYTGPSLFLATTFPLMFLRYVAFPALMYTNGGYEGRSWIPPEESSFDKAAFLMIYEVVLVGAFIAYLEARYHRDKYNSAKADLTLPGWYVILMLGVAFALLIFQPAGLSLINFVLPTVLGDEDVAPAFAALAAMLLMTAKTTLFISILSRLPQLPISRGIALTAALLLCAVNIGIYYGTNRLAVLLTTVANIWIFMRIFQVRSVVPMLGLASVALTLIVVVTAAREYAVQSGGVSEVVADYIQGYVGGLYNVAIGVEVPLIYPEARELSVLAFDFLRPMVGVNLLVQHLDVSYSNVYFNERIWTHVDRRSQIIPMIAQGNLFFTEIFAPILSLLSVWLAYFFMKKLSTTRYLEIKFFLILVVLRFGFFWGQNSMNLVSYVSLNLIIPLLLMGGYLLLTKMERARIKTT